MFCRQNPVGHISRMSHRLGGIPDRMLDRGFREVFLGIYVRRALVGVGLVDELDGGVANGGLLPLDLPDAVSTSEVCRRCLGPGWFPLMSRSTTRDITGDAQCFLGKAKQFDGIILFTCDSSKSVAIFLKAKILSPNFEPLTRNLKDANLATVPPYVIFVTSGDDTARTCHSSRNPSIPRAHC